LLNEAFKKKLNENIEDSKKSQASAEFNEKIILQRQSRILSDLFDIYFTAEC